MKLTKKGLAAAALVAACGVSCLFRVAAAAENDGAGTKCVSPTPVLSDGKAEVPENSVVSQIRSVCVSGGQLVAADMDYLITVDNYVEIDGEFVKMPEGSVSVSGVGAVCVTPTPAPSAME